MRTGPIQHRHQFFRGASAGLVLVAIKFIVFAPVDIADLLYGVAILLTLVIAIGELLEYKRFVLEAKFLISWQASSFLSTATQFSYSSDCLSLTSCPERLGQETTSRNEAAESATSDFLVVGTRGYVTRMIGKL